MPDYGFKSYKVDNFKRYCMFGYENESKDKIASAFEGEVISKVLVHQFLYKKCTCMYMYTYLNPSVLMFLISQ